MSTLCRVFFSFKAFAPPASKLSHTPCQSFHAFRCSVLSISMTLQIYKILKLLCGHHISVQGSWFRVQKRTQKKALISQNIYKGQKKEPAAHHERLAHPKN